MTPSPGPVQPGRRYPVPCIEFSQPQQPSRPLSRNGWPIRWLPILGPVHTDEGVAEPHVHLDTRFLDADDPLTITMVIPVDHRTRFSTKLLTAIRSEPFRWPQPSTGLDAKEFRHCPVIDGICPHKGVPLSAGAREPDGTIQCPGHGLRWPNPTP